MLLDSPPPAQAQGRARGLQWQALRLHDEAARLDLHWQRLDAAERDRAARFFRKVDRARFVVGRSTARALLAQRLGVEPTALALHGNAWGKPALLGAPGVHFNVSHSGGWVLVAVDDAGPLGVDVEAVRPELAELDEFRRVLAPEEAAALDALPAHERARAFARVWVRKEAYVKAIGEGMSRELRDIAVSVQADAPRLLYDRNPGGLDARWRCLDLAIDATHVACLVHRADG